MKISIITPSHNVRFLRELEETIMNQTYKKWEWIILLNQGAKYEPNNERRVVSGEIKIIECPFVNDSVGFLKRLACMQATGDIIAEVDHDDLLVPECLEKLAKAFGDPQVGFVFSQNAKLSKNFRPYLPDYGWTHRKYKWKEKSLYVMENQPVYPGRLGHLWFAPDHIRAWRRDVYESIGGHDDSLKVCDDLDLMHRLYMVTKFKEIPEVLYIYRINGENTFLKKNDMIQEKDKELYDRNIQGLAERFAEVNSLNVLDLSDKDCFAALAMTGDNSTGLIKANDCLQFVKDQQLLMKEVHRVLAQGGMLLSKTPSTDGRGAFQDPAAVSFWNENSFWYYTRAGYAKKIGNIKMFRECSLATVYPDENCKKNKIPYVVAHLEKI